MYNTSSASFRFLFSPAALSMLCWQLNTFLPKIRKGTPVKSEFSLLEFLVHLPRVICGFSEEGGVSSKLTQMIPQLWRDFVISPSHSLLQSPLHAAQLICFEININSNT